MPRPKADAGKVGRAIAAVKSGATLPAAAAREGISLSTLKRALAVARGTTAASASPAPPAASAPSSGTSAPAAAKAAGGLDAAIAAALADLGDDPDPEARVVGAALAELGSKIGGLDAAKLPAAANAVRTLSTTLREMRPPRPPSPDAIAEQLRALDASTREEIERYTKDADKALEGRAAALKLFGQTHLPADLAAAHAALVDGLFAPPEAAAPVATGTA